MRDAGQTPRPSGRAIADELEAGSSCGCHLHFGAERPKTRYGHVWWINLKPFEDPFGEYMSWHDSPYVDMVNHDATDPGDIQRVCPLLNEPPLDTWRRYRREGAACVAAHPTSWWLNRPDDELVVTNITAELPFSLLCGEPPDALVVMGYDPDQIFYQNLWFHLLNEGYRLPGCGETDGSLQGHHHIGQIITYTQLDKNDAYSQASLAKAIKAGHSIMSSGPFIVFSVDEGAYGPGDAVRTSGDAHTLNIKAWSAPEPDEYISWMVVYRNGVPWRVKDLRQQRLRHVEWTEEVREQEYAWYVVKVYGRSGPESQEDLDVFGYAVRCEQHEDVRYRDWKQVALTNPIFFEPPAWSRPVPVLSEITLSISSEQGHQAATGYRVTARLGEQVVFEGKTDPSGKITFHASPAVSIVIEGPDGQKVSKSIFLDYRPVNVLMEDLFGGRWRSAAPALQPGQVPWSAFGLEQMKSALQKVEWSILL